MDWLNSVKDFFNFLPQIIYFIIGCCLQGIDACQFLFRKIIGLDTYYYDGTVAVNPINFGDDSSGDLIMQIFKNVFLDDNFSVIKIAFISMIILGSILLIITTIAAMIKVEYKPDDKAGNSKGKIIGNTIKALGAFFAVPIICYFGIVLGNIALWGIEQVSSPSTTSLSTVGAEITSKLEPSVTVVQEKSSGTTTRVVSYDFYSFFGEKSSSRFTPMSSIAIRLSLRSANRVRLDDNFYVAVTGDGDTESETLSFDIFNAYAGRQNEKELTANAIDSVFMLNAKLKTPQTINENYKPKGVAFSTSGTIEYFDKYDVGLVSYYYDLWYYMWPVSILFIMFVGKTLMAILFGLIKRIYMVFALLLLSPIPISMWPLDGGSALGDWRKKFTTVVFSAYGAVLSMNFFYLIYPVIYSFSFFGPSSTTFSVLDIILQFLFVIAGIMAIKDLDGIITKFFDKDGKGLIGEGESAIKSFTDTSKAAVGSAMKAGKITAGVAMGAGRMAKGAGEMAFGAGRAAVNWNQNRKKRNDLNNKLNDALGRSNQSVYDSKTDAKVKDDVLNSDEFKNAESGAVDSEMDDIWHNYIGLGGKMDKDMVAGFTDDVDKDWENMSMGDKRKFLNEIDVRNMSDQQLSDPYYEKKMREKYYDQRYRLDEALKGRSDWGDGFDYLTGSMKWDSHLENKEKSLTFAQVKEQKQAETHKAMVKSVDDSLKNGKPTGAMGEYTINKREEASAGKREEIEKAKKEADALKKEINNIKPARSTLKRYSIDGAKEIGKGIGTIFKTFAPPKK